MSLNESVDSRNMVSFNLNRLRYIAGAGEVTTTVALTPEEKDRLRNKIMFSLWLSLRKSGYEDDANKVLGRS